LTHALNPPTHDFHEARERGGVGGSREKEKEKEGKEKPKERERERE